ncbi:hypothetical protein [Streptomyces sp. NRRL S-87]|uniref:hypothetical protein n=1 Tax=Streptomyces sp. NRRL S-87 TaxID=1463920 RepID=UPI0004C19E00|nr:hypothetical protein [Streptomyces sp. NRRL S-87]
MQTSSRTTLWAAAGALAAGALLCVLGWYGVSGERFAARQLPYLASCTVPGAALLVAGAVLLAAAWRPSGTGPETGTYARTGEAGAFDENLPDAVGPASDGPPLRVPGGSLAHRPDCPLVDGRADAVAAAPGAGLSPCPVCEPRWPR